MLKPGMLQRRLVGEIITRLERKGLRLVGLKLMTISRTFAENHYGHLSDKPFFGELIGYITSGPVVAMVLEGEEAVSQMRMLCGATRVEEALPGTIRGDYAATTGKNVIHASDGPQTAEEEIGRFFSADEVVNYEDNYHELFV